VPEWRNPELVVGRGMSAVDSNPRL